MLLRILWPWRPSTHVLSIRIIGTMKQTTTVLITAFYYLSYPVFQLGYSLAEP